MHVGKSLGRNSVLFSFIFDEDRYVPEYSSDSIASQKLKKSKRIAAYVKVEF